MPALLLAALVSAWVAPAVADDAPPPPRVVRQVPPVVVRAPAPPPLPEDPTSFSTVIEVEDYAGEAQTVEALLARAPGVQLRRFGGEGDPAEISIRGSTARQVVIQLDGIRLDTAQSGSVDLSTIPLALLDRIEISRGGGAQAGSGAVGGVVNLVTLRPGGPAGRRLIGSAGSFDTYRGSASLRGAAFGLEHVAGYDYFSTDGDWDFDRPDTRSGTRNLAARPPHAERINNENESHSALLGVGRAFGERGYLSLRNSSFYGSRGMPGTDPGGPVDAGQRRAAHERRFRNLASLRWEATGLGPLGLDASADLAHLWERTRFRDPEPALLRVDPISTDDRNGRLTARLGVEGGREVGWLAQHAGAGLELLRETLDSDDFEDQSRRTVAARLQYELGLGRRLQIVPALRWQDTEGFGGEWLPRVGAVVELARGLRLKANLERTYRVPDLDELYFPDKGFLRGNPALQPEDSTDGDIGLEYGLEQLGPLRGLRLEGAWFRREIDESIVFIRINRTTVQPQNTGSATIDGYELAGSLGLGRWLDLDASYTHLDATLDSNGRPLPGRADDEAHVRAQLGPPSGAGRLVVEMQYTSEIPATDTGATVLPSRTVWDAALVFDLTQLPRLGRRIPARELLLSFEAANLTDELVRDARSFPQPGRSFTLRLEAGW